MFNGLKQANNVRSTLRKILLLDREILNVGN
jgi:hypothetical protein